MEARNYILEIEIVYIGLRLNFKIEQNLRMKIMFIDCN